MNHHGKWSFILSLTSLLALVCYCLLAWFLTHRYGLLFAGRYTIIQGSLCGESMLHFIWWGAGLAGWFFIRSENPISLAHRACIWGMLQFIAAWVLACPAFILGRINSSFGMLLMIFAPLATLPSFAAALILGILRDRDKNPRFYLRSRLFCFLTILTFIVTTLLSIPLCGISGTASPHTKATSPHSTLSPLWLSGLLGGQDFQTHPRPSIIIPLPQYSSDSWASYYALQIPPLSTEPPLFF